MILENLASRELDNVRKPCLKMPSTCYKYFMLEGQFCSLIVLENQLD